MTRRHEHAHLDIVAERARHPEAFRGKGWRRWLLVAASLPICST